MTTRTVETTSVSQGWLCASRALLASPQHQVTHLVVRMTEPLPEDEDVRAAVEEVLAAERMQEVVEVSNTIFPAALAADLSGPDELVTAYLEDYEVLRMFKSNTTGTYFGRMCEYPQPDGTGTPQLSNLVRKLKASRAGTRWRAVYQLNIYAEHRDRKLWRGFPCMAHVGFQLGGRQKERLDCLAVYRAQDMLAEGYGNYLGLAQLQEYLAVETGFVPGELTVVAGNATIEKGARRLRQLTDGLT